MRDTIIVISILVVYFLIATNINKMYNLDMLYALPVDIFILGILYVIVKGIYVIYTILQIHNKNKRYLSYTSVV